MFVFSVHSQSKLTECMFSILNALWIARELPFINIEAKDSVKKDIALPV